MSEENKAIVRRFAEEFWTKGKLEVADELLARDFVYHDLSAEEPLDLEGYKQAVIERVNASVDLTGQAEDIVAEGDKVVVRWTWSGTHTSDFFLGAAPTGKRLTTAGIAILRVADGKIVEEWEAFDLLGLERQLCLIPAE